MTGHDRVAIEAAIKQFVVVGPGYWGKGETIKAAKQQCMREGCRAKEKMIAFAGSQDIGVNDAGMVSASFLLHLGEI